MLFSLLSCASRAPLVRAAQVAIYLATDSAAAIQAYKQRYGTKARSAVSSSLPPRTHHSLARFPRASPLQEPASGSLRASSFAVHLRPLCAAQVVYRVDAIRSSGLEPVHLAKGNRASGKKQIRDVVMDALLLGRRGAPAAPPRHVSLWFLPRSGALLGRA